MILNKKKELFKALPPELPKEKIMPDHLPKEIIHYVIRAGIQAPSGDNAQPWKISCQGNIISLYLDREADQSFFNINQFASVVSCGAVLENMRVAATAFGLKVKIVYLPSAGKNDLMASLELFPAKVGRDPLFDSLWKRCTNRKFYDKRSIPPSILNNLQECISDISGTKLHIVAEKSDLKKVARIVCMADRIRTEHRPIHEHLCSMIRYEYREAREKGDGLPLKNLEAGMAGELFLKLTRPWWAINIANKIGLGRMVTLHSYQAINNASAAALITVSGMEYEDFLRAGEAVERVWHTITNKGLAMQPMTAITLFWLRWQIEGEGSFLKKHHQLLRDLWEDYGNMFPAVDFSKEGHVLLFRLGYAKDIKYGTFRKDIDSFLK